MHYKNGREAKNGDQVVMIENGKVPICGVLHGATAGIDTCNGSIRQVNGVDHHANLSECVHAEDVAKFINDDSQIA
jgi:hypothetical protein